MAEYRTGGAEIRYSDSPSGNMLCHRILKLNQIQQRALSPPLSLSLSLSHTHTHSVYLPLTMDRPIAEAFTHKTQNIHKRQVLKPLRDSNPQSQQASSRSLTPKTARLPRSASVM